MRARTLFLLLVAPCVVWATFQLVSSYAIDALSTGDASALARAERLLHVKRALMLPVVLVMELSGMFAPLLALPAMWLVSGGTETSDIDGLRTSLRRWLWLVLAGFVVLGIQIVGVWMGVFDLPDRLYPLGFLMLWISNAAVTVALAHAYLLQRARHRAGASRWPAAWFVGVCAATALPFFFLPSYVFCWGLVYVSRDDVSSDPTHVAPS